MTDAQETNVKTQDGECRLKVPIILEPVTAYRVKCGDLDLGLFEKSSGWNGLVKLETIAGLGGWIILYAGEPDIFTWLAPKKEQSRQVDALLAFGWVAEKLRESQKPDTGGEDG